MFREQDYVAESTDFATMTDDAFFFNYGKMNFGMEILDPFKTDGAWEHIMTGVIVRREVHGEMAIFVEPTILINCDATTSPIQVPPDIWYHAFSAERIQTMPDDTPVTSAKVVFSSQKAGFILKAPASLLFILAQDRIVLPQLTLGGVKRFIENDARLRPLGGILEHVPPGDIQDAGVEVAEFPDLTPKDKDALGGLWESLIPIQQELTAIAKDNPLLSTVAAVMEIPVDRVYALVAYVSMIEDKLHPPQPLLLEYIEECWLLHVTHQGEFISPGLAVGGQEFAWECTFLRARYWGSQLHPDDRKLHKLAAGWADPGNPRIRRANRVGAPYYLNLKRAAWAFVFKVTWANYPPILPNMATWQVPHPPPFPQGSLKLRISHYNQHQAFDVTSDDDEPIIQFKKFASEALGIELSMLEHRQGFLLFQGPDGHYLVKNTAPPYNTRGYAGGLQAYLDMFTDRGMPLRFFSFMPGDACVEADSSVVVDIAFKLFIAFRGRMEKSVYGLADLRNRQLLNVGLVLGDLLSNVNFITDSAAFIRAAKASWRYIPAKNAYVPYFTSAELDNVKEIFAPRDLRKTPPNPVLDHLTLVALEKEHPKEYNQLMQLYWESHPDEYEERVHEPSQEEEVEEYWDQRVNSALAMPWKKEREDDDYEYYRTEEGGEILISKETSLEEEGEDYYEGGEGDEEPDWLDEEEEEEEGNEKEDEGE